MNHIVDELNLLHTELVNNKSLRKIDGNSKLTFMWNQILDQKFKENSPVTWFQTEWLLTENYLYIRIKEIFEKS